MSGPTIPAGNIYWREIPPGARVERRKEIYIYGGRVAFWEGREALEAQKALEAMARRGLTREEAERFKADGTPVIYTGPGSSGRPETYQAKDGRVFNLRGSIHAVGRIMKIMRTKAVIQWSKNQGSMFHLAHIHPATEEELEAVRTYFREWLPNLEVPV